MNPSERKSNVSKLSEHEILEIAKEALQESGIPYEEKPSAQPLPEKMIDPALLEEATSIVPSSLSIRKASIEVAQRKIRMKKLAHMAYVVMPTQTEELTVKSITPSRKSEPAKNRGRKSIIKRFKEAKLKA